MGSLIGIIRLLLEMLWSPLYYGTGLIGHKSQYSQTYQNVPDLCRWLSKKSITFLNPMLYISEFLRFAVLGAICSMHVIEFNTKQPFEQYIENILDHGFHIKTCVFWYAS